MPRTNRRSATRVRDGRVQKKNNWERHRGDYFAWRQDEIRLDRRDPGYGHRHVLTIPQLRVFIELLPDWDDVAVGLDAIVLEAGHPEAMGWYEDGVVALCAWPAHSGYWHEVTEPGWIEANAALLELLDVQVDEVDGRVSLLWTEAQARAFMLLDVLPHELGHHRDLMTTRSRRGPARGEPYAEAYAREVLEAVWPEYCRRFGI